MCRGSEATSADDGEVLDARAKKGGGVQQKNPAETGQRLDGLFELGVVRDKMGLCSDCGDVGSELTHEPWEELNFSTKFVDGYVILSAVSAIRPNCRPHPR